jgi:DNA-directed RNA polymerase specialized sigma subunit
LYEWLRDYQKLEEDASYLEFELERYKKELGRWMSGDLQNTKLEADSRASKLEDIIVSAEHELAHKMNDLFDAKKLISKFKGLENKILFMKYVEGKTLTETAYELGYTPGHIYNKHAQIVKMINFAYHLNLS